MHGRPHLQTYNATVCSKLFFTNSRAFPPASVYLLKNISSPRAARMCGCHAVSNAGSALTNMQSLGTLPHVED